MARMSSCNVFHAEGQACGKTRLLNLVCKRDNTCRNKFNRLSATAPCTSRGHCNTEAERC